MFSAATMTALAWGKQEDELRILMGKRHVSISVSATVRGRAKRRPCSRWPDRPRATESLNQENRGRCFLVGSSIGL